MTVTSCFLNTRVQFESQMGPTLISVVVNVGMMYPFVVKSAANCGIGSVAFAADVATCPFSVPTLILVALVSSYPCGAFGAIYRYVAPESTIPVCSCRRLFSFFSDSLGIYLCRVGLQLKLASYIMFYLLGCLSTPVLSVPKCYSSLKGTHFSSISCFAQPFLSLLFCGLKWHLLFLCSAFRTTNSQCLHIGKLFPLFTVAPLVPDVPFFFSL